ncbi:MAG: hypothetical protein DLM50_03870 [Candidatus Meridianibacter frigidus]|nr:MAG: hypothetical protein DLM50_03870 [Candidatus Eremiobacteraeota bacterium]
MRLPLSAALRTAAVLAVLALAAVNQHARAAALSSGIDLTNLDRTCKPCQDFYQFANGTWMKKNPIPAAYPAYSNFQKLADKNRDVLHGILVAAAAHPQAPGSNAQKIGDFFASCMDTTKIAGLGTRPLDPLFSTVDSITGVQTMAPQLAELGAAGVAGFIDIGAEADVTSSTHEIIGLYPAGLSLPDRDYYLKDDTRTAQIRSEFTAHLSKMLQLMGDAASASNSQTTAIMKIETAMAQAQLSRVQRRDPDLTHHKMSLAGLQALAPNIDWAAYFKTAGVSDTSQINVSQPEYIKALDTLLANTPLGELKAYLRWHVLNAYANALPDAFVNENFNFNGRVLQGTQALQDRWKRCTQATDRNLGEALGQLYVSKTFSHAAKARALSMVQNIKATLRDDLGNLDWMSPPTRARALAKLDAFALKIGYPDKWRDYSAYSVTRDAYAANLVNSAKFETAFDLGKVGHTVDRTEWGMTPPTVNAYYNPTINEIVFPAGILQPPFFNANADMAVNYGGIGAVIGHESTHGFDDQGRRFDLNGNLTNWWTDADATAFNAKAQCIVNQFDALEPLPGVKENGKLVQGEEIADLGGLTIAYKAFEKYQAARPRRTIDGFTPEQRFFLGWAQVWASNQRPEYIRLLAGTDVHAYDKFRINAIMANMAAFQKAWFCKLGDPMVRPATQRCQIW